VRAFLAAIRAGAGDPGFVVKTGTADMNVVGPAWGCPILAYGPGDSRLDHTPHEHLSISELQRSIDVLQRVVTSLTAIM
jgi:LysW-gamma-L-lysine carboxypeptidase